MCNKAAAGNPDCGLFWHLGTFLLCRHLGTLLVIGAKQPVPIALSGVCR